MSLTCSMPGKYWESLAQRRHERLASRRSVILRGNNLAYLFPMSRKCQGSADSLLIEFRMVPQDLIVGHTGCKPLENVHNGDSGSYDTWLPKTDLRVDGDVLFVVVHSTNIRGCDTIRNKGVRDGRYLSSADSDPLLHLAECMR